jgi:predicted nucleotidyltransferase
MDKVTRRAGEDFEYGYKVLLNERKEKVVIKTETIGRPMESTNYNTGKKTYVHDIKVFFQDGSMIEMDALEFINQFYTKKQLVPDSDIIVKDGVKQYTFRTEQFGTFTVAENFIN